MKADDLLGLDAPLALLRRALAAERLPHALLFQGPEGIGKATVARILAGAMLCERAAPEDRPCSECAACRKLAHANHPDFMLVERLPKKASASVPDPDDAESEDEDEGGNRRDLRPFIVVDQIRELNAHAAYAPREGRTRVFVIDPADRMNVEAQNALLKTLEEPPGRALLVLVASRPHLLLPTVRSRCFSVRFASMSVTELARALEERGIARDEALARAALAGGRPGRALTLAPETLRERRDEILRTLEQLAKGPRALADLAAMTSLLVGSDEFSLLEGIDLVEALLRDAAVAAAAGSAARLVHADLAPRLQALGAALGSGRAASLVRSVEKLRSELRFNLNRTLLAEALFASIAS